MFKLIHKNKYEPGRQKKVKKSMEIVNSKNGQTF